MKGRKPSSENVVPLTDNPEAKGTNFEARAAQRSRELKPEGLPFTVSAIWDRIALPLCDPRKNRLTELNAYMFEQLCWTIDRHERLRVELDKGETYESQTRNGVQQKNIPGVSQYNETWRQIRSLASDFGMTPAAERGLQSSGQMGFSFDDDSGDFD